MKLHIDEGAVQVAEVLPAAVRNAEPKPIALRGHMGVVRFNRVHAKAVAIC